MLDEQSTIKLEALTMAIKHHTSDGLQTADVVETAKAFEKFLLGIEEPENSTIYKNQEAL